MTSSDAPVTVADVIDVRSWGIVLLAGAEGVDRSLTWAHVFDVPDPSAWVDGGELVIMTGSQFPADPSEQAALVRRLHERNAAALAVGHQVPALGEEFVEAAETLGFPVMQIPRNTGYLPIVKFIAAANGSTVQRTMVASLRIFETLAPWQEDVEPATRYRQIERISGYSLCIVSDGGRSLFPGMEGVPAELMESVRTTVSEPQRWASLAIPNGYASVLRVGDRRAGFLVAQERPDLKPAGLSVFRSVETIARIDLGNLYRRREAARRRGGELLTRFLHRPETMQDRSESGQDGWSTSLANEVIVAAVRTEKSASPLPNLDGDIYHGLVDRGIKPLLLSENDRIVVALGVADVHALVDLAQRLPVHVGLSAPRQSLLQASVALREALWALQYGERSSGSAISSFDGRGLSWTSWLPSDQAALAQLVGSTLGPLVDYDQKRDAQLLESLRVYFQFDGRLQAAAQHLHIHKHTLAYRLKRIEELTGRDLDSLGDKAQLWMALAAQDVISHS
jgi:purine catabolism regulator